VLDKLLNSITSFCKILGIDIQTLTAAFDFCEFAEEEPETAKNFKECLA